MSLLLFGGALVVVQNLDGFPELCNASVHKNCSRRAPPTSTAGDPSQTLRGNRRGVRRARQQLRRPSTSGNGGVPFPSGGWRTGHHTAVPVGEHTWLRRRSFEPR
jgi:hypothetical protein